MDWLRAHLTLQRTMDRLLPRDALGDYRAMRRGRLIIGLCGTLMVLTVLVGFSRLAVGEVALAATSATMFVLFLVIPLSLRRFGLAAPAHILMTLGAAIIFCIIAMTGGASSSAMLYLPCLGSIALVLLGPRAGTAWVLLMVLGCAAIYLGEPYLAALPVHPDPMSRGISRAVLSLGIVSAVMFFSEHTNTLAQQALAEACQQADDANAAKSIFLATMSHELRTPMNGVLGLTEVLLREPHTPRQAMLLQNISASGTALIQQLNELLDFSKIEAGELTLESVPYQPAALLSEVRDLLQGTASRAGLALRLSGTGLEQWVSGDPTRLKQVLLNLVGNALKFTEDGAVEIAAAWSAGRLSVRVTDTGIGVPADRLPLLFEPFTQADDTVTRRYGGTGLGLAICRRLVANMGGEIGAESTPGVGSTFWFHLAAPAHAAPAAAPAAAPQAPEGSGERILLAEDNRINRLVAVNLLESLGYRVSVVPDGQAAVEAALAEDFAAILMDNHMPVMDGPAATRALRAAGCGVPIIALTASVESEARDVCLAAGMDDFVTKPIDAQTLARVLASALEPTRQFG